MAFGTSTASSAGTLNVVNTIIQSNQDSDGFTVNVDGLTPNVVGNAATVNFATPGGGGAVEDFLFINNVVVSDTAGTPFNVFTQAPSSSISTPTVGTDNTIGRGGNFGIIIANGTTFDNTGANTSAPAADIQGTIDLSAYSTGTVYFIHGSFEDFTRINVTLTGSTDPDVLATSGNIGVVDSNPESNAGEFTESNTDFLGSQTGFAVSAFEFDTAGGFTTLDFEALNSDLDGSRARFAGIVIDAVPVPEPGS